jgi:hypothetical protein
VKVWVFCLFVFWVGPGFIFYFLVALGFELMALHFLPLEPLHQPHIADLDIHIHLTTEGKNFP